MGLLPQCHWACALGIPCFPALLCARRRQRKIDFQPQSHGQRVFQNQRKSQAFSVSYSKNCYNEGVLLQWSSCMAFIIALRQGWTCLWAWTWTWWWRQHILHPMEGLCLGPRYFPWGSALLCKLLAETLPSAAQLACLARTKQAHLSNSLFLFVSIMLNTCSSCPWCRYSLVFSSTKTSVIL